MGEKRGKQGIRKRREEGAGGGESNEVAINVFWGALVQLLSEESRPRRRKKVPSKKSCVRS